MEKRMLKPAEICDEVIETYAKKVDYPVLKSVTLGVLAGAFIALGGFAAALASHSIENVGVAKLVAGSIFPVGLMLILICGADLFTGNVLVTVPLVDGKIKVGKLFKNWFIIYFSNMVGAIIVAFLIYSSGSLDTNNNMLGGYALKVAATKASLPFGKALASGILCNVLVCIAVWMSFSAKDIAGKILAIWFPIMAFIVGGFEHCVANMYYFSIALFAKADPKYAEAFHVTPEKLAHINLTGIIENLIPVTLGNIIGGGLFIGVAFWFAFKYTTRTNNIAKVSGKNSKAV
jgi:formate/nitrite transporter